MPGKPPVPRGWVTVHDLVRNRTPRPAVPELVTPYPFAVSGAPRYTTSAKPYRKFRDAAELWAAVRNDTFPPPTDIGGRLCWPAEFLPDR